MNWCDVIANWIIGWNLAKRQFADAEKLIFYPGSDASLGGQHGGNKMELIYKWKLVK